MKDTQKCTVFFWLCSKSFLDLDHEVNGIVKCRFGAIAISILSIGAAKDTSRRLSRSVGGPRCRKVVAADSDNGKNAIQSYLPFAESLLDHGVGPVGLLVTIWISVWANRNSPIPSPTKVPLLTMG